MLVPPAAMPGPDRLSRILSPPTQIPLDADPSVTPQGAVTARGEARSLRSTLNREERVLESRKRTRVATKKEPKKILNVQKQTTRTDDLHAAAGQYSVSSGPRYFFIFFGLFFVATL